MNEIVRGGARLLQRLLRPARRAVFNQRFTFYSLYLSSCAGRVRRLNHHHHPKNTIAVCDEHKFYNRASLRAGVRPRHLPSAAQISKSIF